MTTETVTLQDSKKTPPTLAEQSVSGYIQKCTALLPTINGDRLRGDMTAMLQNIVVVVQSGAETEINTASLVLRDFMNDNEKCLGTQVVIALSMLVGAVDAVADIYYPPLKPAQRKKITGHPAQGNQILLGSRVNGAGSTRGRT